MGCLFLSATVISLALFDVVLSNWENGQLNVGDSYNDVIFQTNAYSVYRFPYGISYFGLVPDVSSNNLWTVLKHTVCPAGQYCQESSTFLARLGPSDLTVQALEPYNTSAYGNPMPPNQFRLRLSNGTAYFLTDGRSLGKLMQYNLTNAVVAAAWPADSAQLSWTANGVIDEAGGAAYVLSFQLRTLSKVSLPSMQLQWEADLTPIVAWNHSMLVGVDNSSGLVHVAGWLNSTGIPRWGILHLDPATGQQARPFVDYLASLALPEGRELAFMIADRLGAIYLGVNTPLPNLTFAPPVQMQFVKIDRPGLPSWAVSSTPYFWTRPYQDHFFDYSTGLLYTTTMGGQLIRVRCSPLSLNGTMTLVTQAQDVHDYSGGVMPSLQSAVLYEPGVTAWLGTSWWGNMIKVNLQNFCDDNDPCAAQADPANQHKARLHGWQIGLISAACVVVVVGAAVALIVVVRRRRLRQFVPLETYAAGRGNLQYVPQPTYSYQQQTTVYSVAPRADTVVYGTL